MQNVTPKLNKSIVIGLTALVAAFGAAGALGTRSAYYHYASRPEMPQTVNDMPYWLLEKCVVSAGAAGGAAEMCSPLSEDAQLGNFHWVQNNPQSYLENVHRSNSDTVAVFGFLAGTLLGGIASFAMGKRLADSKQVKTNDLNEGPTPL